MGGGGGEVRLLLPGLLSAGVRGIPGCIPPPPPKGVGVVNRFLSVGSNTTSLYQVKGNLSITRECDAATPRAGWCCSRTHTTMILEDIFSASSLRHQQ